jgi:DNA repair exonuclease SbcCD ATPase subunit
MEENNLVNMFPNTKKKDENTPIEDPKQVLKTEAPPAQAPGQTATVLQKLKMEEAQLAEEKRNLAQLKEQLQKKIKDQIESSKDNLQKLKNEVSSLKAECAELNESLQNEVFAE